jgi:type I restriction enzyme R subunit
MQSEAHSRPPGQHTPKERDCRLYALARPARLLELAYSFILHDKGERKIARYQQYFAVKEALARAQQFYAAGKREGCVIWHTQGSAFRRSANAGASITPLQ